MTKQLQVVLAKIRQIEDSCDKELAEVAAQIQLIKASCEAELSPYKLERDSIAASLIFEQNGVKVGDTVKIRHSWRRVRKFRIDGITPMFGKTEHNEFKVVYCSIEGKIVNNDKSEGKSLTIAPESIIELDHHYPD